ncbi:transglutaminase [filamentous cyanobacterium CCP5]|nr:transglutaminase [filamentous cyanobacterium CCP5]
MRFHIRHDTCYSYSHPVQLQPHTIRLHPRSDAAQTLHQFHISVSPEPKAKSAIVDLAGNNLLRLWFDESPTTALKIHTQIDIETLRNNPFDYLGEPWATQFPLDYPSSLATCLQPYLCPRPYTADAEAANLAQEIWQETEGNVSFFLTTLARRISQDCDYQVREVGPPMPAGLTWRQRRGSCRDFTVLYIVACQSMGLAARFVSGYEAGDPDQDQHDLHAWAEVYIPGGGWRGMDPTYGLAVGDRHVALVASPFPQQTTPVAGRIKPPGTASSLQTDIHLDVV